MSRLYEKFILEYYAQEFGQKLTGFSSRAAQIPWKLDDGYDALLPVMQTDITLTYGDKTLIIDAKYYERTLQTNYDVQTLHSGNLYQIFTYVKNKEAEVAGTGHQISGMLLYAKTDEDLVPNNVYRMSGNQISVKTLDLNCEFPMVARQLDQIVEAFLNKNGSEVTERKTTKKSMTLPSDIMIYMKALKRPDTRWRMYLPMSALPLDLRWTAGIAFPRRFQARRFRTQTNWPKS